MSEQDSPEQQSEAAAETQDEKPPGVNRALDILIERTERRLAKVEESLNSGKLSSERELKYTEAFTKLVGTLRALYALKRGQILPEEEGVDLAKILSDLEKEAKLYVKRPTSPKRPKQHEKVEEPPLKITVKAVSWSEIKLIRLILQDVFRFVPGPRVTNPITKKGDIPRYDCSFDIERSEIEEKRHERGV